MKTLFRYLNLKSVVAVLILLTNFFQCLLLGFTLSMSFTILNNCYMSPLLLRYSKNGSDNALSRSIYGRLFCLEISLEGFDIDLIPSESGEPNGIVIFQMRSDLHSEQSRDCHLIKACQNGPHQSKQARCLVDCFCNMLVNVKVERSKWAAPIVVVPKANGSIRICGDYKVTINKVVDDTCYPLPTAGDLFAKLAGGKVFTKLDLSNTYQQLGLSEESKEYLTVNTHKGLFQ